MSNDIFKSMKNQMMPSDDCVNDLLAKIAALDASGDTETKAEQPKVIQFEPRVENEQPKVKKSNRKAWGFSTAAVAAVIALAAIFTNIGDTPDNIKASLDDVISNPEVVSNQDVINENTVGTVIIDEDENLQDSSKENENGTGEAASDNKKDNNSDNSVKDTENKGVLSKLFATKSNNGSDGTSTGNGTNSNTSGEAEAVIPVHNTTTVEVPEDTKITPSTASTNELTWTREILADSSVKEITIEGSNYVVNSSVDSVVTGTKIQTLSLSVPETETTAADTVKADALKVANVSSDLVLAIEVDEYSGKLIYLNEDYSPENLGQFLSDAGIQSGTEFTSVVYTGDRIGYSSGKRITKSIKAAAVKNLYIKDAPLVESSNYNGGTEKIVFVSNSNPTNTKISFGVSNNGYFRVVLSNCNVYTFDIGAENANAFIDAALED